VRRRDGARPPDPGFALGARAPAVRARHRAIMADMPEQSIVNLPPGVRAPFDVYVNGVHQQPGVDFDVRGRSLVFGRELKKEGKLGFWRWFLGAWGVGTYRQNDSVDVRYERDGHPVLLEGLDIEQG
jgi:hypothetical protein